MRCVVCFLTVLLLLSALVVPALAVDLQGGYYVVADSALGSGLRFYVPADYATGSLTYDSSGYLFNLTASSVYLYSPDYPDYTIYAPRFSGFQYRSGSGSGYSYLDLNVTNVSDTNVEILSEDPVSSLRDNQLLLMIVVLLVLLVGVSVVCVRR